MISRSGTRKSSDAISRSGTRKSSDANVLAVKQGFDFPLVFRKSSDFRYERCGFFGSLPTSATKDVGNDNGSCLNGLFSGNPPADVIIGLDHRCRSVKIGLPPDQPAIPSSRLMYRLARALSLVGLCFAALVSAGNAAPSFETDVRPILKAHCFQCHGEEPEVQGNLDVRLVRLMQQGGDSGAAIIPDKPEESPLYQRLHDGEMPPDESKLISQEELRTIRDWIAAGAKTLRPEPERIGDEPFITEEEKSHWAFQPIRRVSVPQPAGADRIANPIDAFLLQRLEANGLTFSPPASPRTLIRRLSLDLLGLPPEPELVAQFLQQDSRTLDGRDVWSATVDRLLQSPHYGERWARHWLDVAGYADSEGYNDVDAVRPDAWRYRDYVIRAMNADMPFDQFITEQLAGDELVTSPLKNLSDEDAQLLVATGFLRMAPDGTGGAVADKLQARDDTIADTIRIVSSSLLGMTVGCAMSRSPLRSHPAGRLLSVSRDLSTGF